MLLGRDGARVFSQAGDLHHVSTVLFGLGLGLHVDSSPTQDSCVQTPAVELGLKTLWSIPSVVRRGKGVHPAGGSPTALKVPDPDQAWVLACLPTAPSIEAPLCP